MKAFFAPPEKIARHMVEADKNLSAKETLLQSHEREIQKVRDEMTRTHRLSIWTARSRPKDSASSTSPPRSG
jgi:hypothetical protein